MEIRTLYVDKQEKSQLTYEAKSAGYTLHDYIVILLWAYFRDKERGYAQSV